MLSVTFLLLLRQMTVYSNDGTFLAAFTQSLLRHCPKLISESTHRKHSAVIMGFRVNSTGTAESAR